MAFYDNRSDKRRNNRRSSESWEEEGSRYRGANRRNDDGKPRAGKYRAEGERRFGPKPEGFRGPRRDDDRRGPARDGRSFDRKPRESRDGDRRPAFRRDGEHRPERELQPETRPAPSYRDFEHVQAEPAPAARGERRPIPFEEEAAPENLLAGRNPIREALKSGRYLEKLLVQRGELSGSAREIVAMARERHIIVQEVDKARLDAIAPHHQGMLAFASAYQYASVDDMLQLAADRGQEPFLILLDGVTDPHNLGAVIRTAECVGAHGVIVPERRSVGLTPAAVKASAGAVEHIKVARVTNLNRTIEDLKERGVWTYAVTMDGEDYMKVNFTGGVALVIGAEGEGISRLTLECCDQRVSLPMEGSIDSLNASVAAGVMMYRVLASRRA